MSRRDVLKLLAASAVGTALAACVPATAPVPAPAGPAKEPTPAPEPTQAPPQGPSGEVKFLWLGDLMDQYTEYAKKFQETHPQIKLTLDSLPFTEFETKIRTMFAAGNPPDVFWLYFNNIFEFVGNDVLLPLNPYIDRDKFPIQDFAQANLDMFTIGGKLYGIPRESSTLVLYWSEKAFKDAGIEPPDDTWDWEGKFLEAAQKLTVPSDDPTVRRYGFNPPVGAGMNWAAMPIVWSFGGDIVNKDKTKATVNDPNTINGYQWLADLINVHKVAPAIGSLAGMSGGEMFLKGQIAMYVSGKWEIQGLRDTIKQLGIDTAFDVALMPKGPAGRVTRTSGAAYAIPKAAKNPDGAWELVKWWESKEFVTLIAETGGMFPAYLPVLNSDSFLQPGQPPAHTKAFVDSLAFARPEAVFAKYSELTNLVEAGMDPVWAGQQSAQEALTEVQRKAEALFTK
jgi:multiple sugar transport system substrate-binding protein